MTGVWSAAGWLDKRFDSYTSDRRRLSGAKPCFLTLSCFICDCWKGRRNVLFLDGGEGPGGMGGGVGYSFLNVNFYCDFIFN